MLWGELIMFGFDGATKGLEQILNRYVKNHQNITHKEIRAYARCLLKIIPEITFSSRLKPEIETLLAALSAFGLPHYDRVFLATRILKLLEESNNPEENICDIF